MWSHIDRLRVLHRQRQISCPSCKAPLVQSGHQINDVVQISECPGRDNVLELCHRHCDNPRKLFVCTGCGKSSCQGMMRLIKRNCRCEPAVNDADTDRPAPVSADVGGGPAGETDVNVDELGNNGFGGSNDYFDGDDAEAEEAEEEKRSNDFEVRQLFESGEWPANSSTFFTREHLRAGDGKRGVVYNSLIHRDRKAGFDDLRDDEMHYHLHIASVHHDMPQSKSKDVCAMVGHMVSRNNAQRAEDLQTMRATFEESIMEVFGDGPQFHKIKQAVAEKMEKLHQHRDKCQKINDPTAYSQIRRCYVQGTNSILQKMPVPDVDILHECAHVPAKQIVNHLLAMGLDALTYRAGFEEEWLNNGRYECDFVKELHARVKKRMADDPNIPKDTRVLIVRLWSDGFEAFQIKGKNDYNSLQLFTLTLRAPKGKNTARHTLPFGLCFKKQNHDDIVLQLLTEVVELQAVQSRYFGKERRVYKAMVYVEIVSNDYPERCANTSIAQLGTYTHRWLHSSKYNDSVTPSCASCQLRRIECLLGSKDTANENFDAIPVACSGCTDWWSQGRKGVYQSSDRYPIQPGVEMEGPFREPCVELSFEMLEKSVDDVERWFKGASSAGNLGKREMSKLKQEAKDYLKKVGVATNIVPQLVQDMADGVDAKQSEAYPKLWKRSNELQIALKQFATMPMHLAPLGVEKSLMSKTALLVNRGKKNQNDLWHELTNSMQKTQKWIAGASIDWCLSMSFSGKDAQHLGTANWHSEHFLTFTRLSLFHFAPLDGTIQIPAEKKALFDEFRCVRVLWFCLVSSMFAEVDVPTSRIDNLVKLFLSSCRSMWTLAQTELSGEECSEDKEEEEEEPAGGAGRREKDNEEEEETISEGGKDGEEEERKVEEVEEEVGKKMTTKRKKRKKRQDWFMSKTEIDALIVKDLQKEIRKRGLVPEGNKEKLQKMMYNCMEKEMPLVPVSNRKRRKKNSNTPFFISGSNYLSLLNIPDMVTYFGSMRDAWEGENEKYIQCVKRELDTMRHTIQFLVTILHNLLCTWAFSQLNENNPYSDHTKYARTNNLKVYKNKKGTSILDLLDGEDLVVGLVDEEGKMFLCVEETGGDGGLQLYPVVFDDGRGYWCYNLWYAPATVDSKCEYCQGRKESMERAADFFVMLKSLREAEESSWTVICKSWRVRQNTGQLMLPVPRKEIFFP